MDPGHNPSSPKKRFKEGGLRRTSWRGQHFIAGLIIGVVGFVVWIFKEALKALR